MSAFDDLFAGCLPALEHSFGVAATYRRGDQFVALSQVPVAHSEWEDVNEYGASVLVETRDYLVRRADLVFGTDPVLPQRGDLVEETVAGQAVQYEVICPPQQRHYKFEDDAQTVLRIFTKRRATAA